jgi:hypothetical protein
MSSVSRFLKQMPNDNQYFIPINGGTEMNLNVFNTDSASSTATYVSGAIAGNFTTSNITPTSLDTSGTLSLFRDMGKTLVSSGRTFRRVQYLVLNTNGWTSSNSGTPGTWTPSNEGVLGKLSTQVLQDSSFGVFYFETGARGLGLAQGLIRYG